jgi:hypothetical protein
MKKLMVLLVMIITTATVSIQAQNNDPITTKKEMRKEKKEMRKEKHKERKELKKLEGKDVSFQAKQQFAIDFGNVPDPQWTRTLYFDEVTFTDKDGRPTTAYYDDMAQLVGTSSPRKFSDLPMNAQTAIAKDYLDYTDAPVIFYDDNENNDTDMFIYGVQLNGADNYFIELKDKKNNPIVLRIDMDGEVSYFTEMKK